eukprot:scaffold668855_cov38-Prasinocladus_malaysianus.AAC.1
MEAAPLSAMAEGLSQRQRAAAMMPRLAAHGKKINQLSLKGITVGAWRHAPCCHCRRCIFALPFLAIPAARGGLPIDRAGLVGWLA